MPSYCNNIFKNSATCQTPKADILACHVSCFRLYKDVCPGVYRGAQRKPLVDPQAPVFLGVGYGSQRCFTMQESPRWESQFPIFSWGYGVVLATLSSRSYAQCLILGKMLFLYAVALLKAFVIPLGTWEVRFEVYGVGIWVGAAAGLCRLRETSAALP